MHNHLDKIQCLLDEFEAELSKIRAIWRQIEIDNPSFEQVSEENWQEKHARMWLHGATSVQDCNELERWLFDAPPLTHTAQMPAINVYLFKALALGADACMIGKPWIYGLAARGEVGISEILNILQNELKIAMIHFGATSVHEINKNLIKNVEF